MVLVEATKCTRAGELDRSDRCWLDLRTGKLSSTRARFNDGLTDEFFELIDMISNCKPPWEWNLELENDSSIPRKAYVERLTRPHSNPSFHPEYSGRCAWLSGQMRPRPSRPFWRSSPKKPSRSLRQIALPLRRWRHAVLRGHTCFQWGISPETKSIAFSLTASYLHCVNFN